MHRRPFSSHAISRLAERLAMHPSELLELIAAGKTVKVGEENGTNRVHLALYDESINGWFVVIRDFKYGTIVTVLPLHFYENLNGMIPPDLLEKAKAVALGIPFEPPELNKPAPAESDLRMACKQPAASFKISCSTINADGKIKSYNLGSLPLGDYGSSVHRLLGDFRAIRELKQRLAAKAQPDELLNSICVRVGKRIAGLFISKPLGEWTFGQEP